MVVEAYISEIMEEIYRDRKENPDLPPLTIKDFIDRGVKIKCHKNELFNKLMKGNLHAD